MADTASTAVDDNGTEESRRDFLLLATSAVGAVGTAAAIWPFVDSMNPSADVLALASTEIDLSPIEEGQSITVMWRGKPVFVRNRTADEISKAQAEDSAAMVDPQKDGERIKEGKDNWLVLVGVCTHLGCIPLGQKATDPKGEYGGWYCPCHGSHYDTSGRIRKGPAPTNLPVPPYEFTSDTTVKIG
ncbi:MAG: ubiquinol-cytochrome c reductase iron-sulfur subunit [Rhodospirillales bacterium]|nr:ubiquinol-cytochrome c reductase iron-sulfur subunit [Rhodospirillales bacterium]